MSGRKNHLKKKQRILEVRDAIPHQGEGEEEEPSPSSSGRDVPLDLTKLPNELLQMVFSHLDLRTFKSVRQVNKRFKAAADTPSAWGNFVVAIPPGGGTGEGDRQNILRSAELLPWKNFRMLGGLGNYDDSWIKELCQIIQQKRTIIKYSLTSLDMDFQKLCSIDTFKSKVLNLIPVLKSCGPSLENLANIGLLSIRLFSCLIEDDGTPSLELLELDADAELAALQLPLLRNLTIVCDEVGLHFFHLKSFLSRCPSLKKLRFVIPDDSDIYQVLIELFDDAIIAPILSYLEEMPEDRTATFTVTFTSKTKKWMVPLKPQSLKDLLTHPKGSLLRLENVPFSAIVATLKHHPYLHDQVKTVVKSVIATTEDLKKVTAELAGLPVPRTCRQMLPSVERFELVAELTDAGVARSEVMLPEKVQSITLILDDGGLLYTTRENGMLRPFVEDLLNTVGTDLEELKILTDPDTEFDERFVILTSINFLQFPRFRNFPNLKILHFDHWGWSNKDFWKIYENLPLLEELALRKCYNLMDKGVVGDLKGKSMLQLKRLKTLIIEGCLSITYTSFEKVFSQLPLQRLEVSDNVERPCKTITMKAFHALADDSSLTSNTLETLKVSKPARTSLATIKETLQGCRALQSVQLLEKTRGSSEMKTHFIKF